MDASVSLTSHRHPVQEHNIATWDATLQTIYVPPDHRRLGALPAAEPRRLGGAAGRRDAAHGAAHGLDLGPRAARDPGPHLRLADGRVGIWLAPGSDPKDRSAFVRAVPTSARSWSSAWARRPGPSARGAARTSTSPPAAWRCTSPSRSDSPSARTTSSISPSPISSTRARATSAARPPLASAFRSGSAKVERPAARRCRAPTGARDRGPATRGSDAYRGGTCARWRRAARARMLDPRQGQLFCLFAARHAPSIRHLHPARRHLGTRAEAGRGSGAGDLRPLHERGAEAAPDRAERGRDRVRSLSRVLPHR